MMLSAIRAVARQHVRCVSSSARKDTAATFAFVGSYTGYQPGELGWVGSSNPGVGITTFVLDTATGKLSPTGLPVEQDCPTWLELSQCKNYLVAAHELGGANVAEGYGFLTSYEINPVSGSLAKVCTTPTGGRGNTCVGFDRTGRFVLTTRYWEGGIAVLPFRSDGSIGAVCAAPIHQGRGPHPARQSMPHPHGIHGDPDADIVYAMDLGTDCVHQYRLDTDSGSLAPLGAETVHLGAESGPRGLVFHPTRRLAYVTCELDGTVVSCRRTAVGLEPFAKLLVYPPKEEFVALGHPDNKGKGEYWTAEAAITADGSFVYCICRVHHSLAICRVDADGGLELVGRQALAPGSNARNLTVHGDFLLVASQDADSVESHRIDRETGQLTLVDVKAVDCAADVAVA